MKTKTQKPTVLSMISVLFLGILMILPGVIADHPEIDSSIDRASDSVNGVADAPLEGGTEVPAAEQDRSRRRDVDSLVKVKVLPRNQIAREGEAIYEVVIFDSHDRSTSPEFVSYDLSFESREEGTTGTLEEETVSIRVGGETTVTLDVSSENKGLSFFTVFVESEDARARAIGSITVPASDISSVFQAN